MMRGESKIRLKRNRVFIDTLFAGSYKPIHSTTVLLARLKSKITAAMVTTSCHQLREVIGGRKPKRMINSRNK